MNDLDRAHEAVKQAADELGVTPGQLSRALTGDRLAAIHAGDRALNRSRALARRVARLDRIKANAGRN